MPNDPQNQPPAEENANNQPTEPASYSPGTESTSRVITRNAQGELEPGVGPVSASETADAARESTAPQGEMINNTGADQQTPQGDADAASG